MKLVAAVLGILLGSWAAWEWERDGLPQWCDTRIGGIFEPTAADTEPRLVVHASAYCPCQICTGKWSGGPTASGIMPTEGVTLAADTRFFPFETCLDIPKIGQRVVMDTGSAIKVFRVDVFFKDHATAVVFGFKRDLLVGFCDE